VHQSLSENSAGICQEFLTRSFLWGDIGYGVANSAWPEADWDPGYDASWAFIKAVIRAVHSE
jgi:hypothetical protein